jgi:hypothetical protein
MHTFGVPNCMLSSFCEAIQLKVSVRAVQLCDGEPIHAAA